MPLKKEKPLISIVGSGNVGSHLARAFKDKAEITTVNPYTFEGFRTDSDLVLLCVKDDAISSVKENLPDGGYILAHTAGSVPLSFLEGKGIGHGVLYPLQTFSKDVELDYSEIPVFVEGSSPSVEDFLTEVADLFSKTVGKADSEQRKRLHLASVFACNFTNSLACMSHEILEECNIDPKMMIPLIDQTIRKLRIMDPDKAQTGPASRGDSETIGKHIDMLEGKTDLQKIYKDISDYIIKRHAK